MPIDGRSSSRWPELAGLAQCQDPCCQPSMFSSTCISGPQYLAHFGVTELVRLFLPLKCSIYMPDDGMLKFFNQDRWHRVVLSVVVMKYVPVTVVSIRSHVPGSMLLFFVVERTKSV